MNKIMKKVVVCLLFVAATLSAKAVDTVDDFRMFMDKIREDVRNNPKTETIKKELLLYNTEDGSFTDIDYARTDRTNWMPIIHVERLSDFAFAYTNPDNAYYGDDAIYEKIVKGLEYWQMRNPNCSNWWYNQISEPQKLGVLLVQMRVGKKLIPQELEDAILQRIRKDGGDPAKWTGANRTDIALHWIYRSCLQKNEADLKRAIELVYSPICYTTKEGFQHDNCFFQHGEQLYIGGYGDEILKGITQIASYAIGTKFAMDEEKIQLVSRFMRETYYQAIRGKYMMFDVMGRGMSRKNILDKSGKALFAKRMIKIDPKHADEFKDIVARLKGKKPASYAVKPKHTHYFRGDYTLHVRPGYTFDVRMASNRTGRCEYGNGENLKTYFVSDGCTDITKEGNEYFNIFPVWNWARIPGTTAPQMTKIPLAKNAWKQMGTSTFSGGVSDSLYGVSTYVYDEPYANINTRAKKAWFFFDDEIVCLGAGITSESEFEVMTTVNQCLSFGKEANVSSAKNKLQKIANGEEHTVSNLRWAMHNGVGYVFPDKNSVLVSNKEQTGVWYDINQTQSKKMQHEDVFTIALRHGVKPSNATYAYMVVPEAKNGKQLDGYAKGPVAILSNTSSVQAVQQKNLGIWQMVFHAAGKYSDKNITVSVDKPCALMVRTSADKKGVTLHIADPAQKQGVIKVGVKVSGAMKKAVAQECDFTNTGIYAGATKAYKIQ